MFRNKKRLFRSNATNERKVKIKFLCLYTQKKKQFTLTIEIKGEFCSI